MLEGLFQYLFQRQAKKFIKEKERWAQFVNYRQAKSIFILFESDNQERNTFIHETIGKMKNDGKKVCAWGYSRKKEVSAAVLPQFRILCKKDVDFYGKPAASHLRELEDMEFDLLIDLSWHTVIPLEYIVLHANARYKCGSLNTGMNVYDFILDLEKIKLSVDEDKPVIDEKYLYDQIIFYLKSIQTTD